MSEAIESNNDQAAQKFPFIQEKFLSSKISISCDSRKVWAFSGNNIWTFEVID